MTSDDTRTVRLGAWGWTLVTACLLLCAASTGLYAWRRTTDWSPGAEWARTLLSHQTNATGVFAGVVALGTVALLRGSRRRADVSLALVLGLGSWALEYLPLPNNTVDWRDVVAGFAAAALGLAALTTLRLSQPRRT